MKYVILSCVFLAGCATNDYSQYVDAHKTTSKDITVAELACYTAATEGMKSSDNTMKTAAVALMVQCKKERPVIEPPKKNLLGF